MTNEEAINVLRGQESAYWNTFSETEHKAFDLAVDALIAKQPRVLTLEEVIKHYSLPPVFVDDLYMQEDYLQDIQPLYFDFPIADSWAVHWRGYQQVAQYFDIWKPEYGKTWRCWTARPTDEQREEVKWNDED